MFVLSSCPPPPAFLINTGISPKKKESQIQRQDSSVVVLPGRKENRAKDLRILQENSQSDGPWHLYVPSNTDLG